jgi:four helix bundle protein
LQKNVKGYHQLKIVEPLKEFIKYIYVETELFPKSELYGLTSQLRRATLSTLLNIVEGHRRGSNKEFIRFLKIADASLAEVEACLEISLELQFINDDRYEILELKRREIAYMLTSFIKAIRNTL